LDSAKNETKHYSFHLLCRAAIFIIYNFPIIKQATLEALETIFQTKAIGRQLALAIALETGMVTVNQVLRVVKSILSNFSSRSRLIRHLERQQNLTQSQDEWMDLAERIDNVQGNDVWRSDPNCQLYERERIAARVDEFVHLMRRRDIFELVSYCVFYENWCLAAHVHSHKLCLQMFVLRGGIARNMFGLLHEGLFSKAMAGSKVLVET
jgi:TAG lipase/steryl ester hydrolase/phospholipase A2/LPA acyltransferase